MGRATRVPRRWKKQRGNRKGESGKPSILHFPSSRRPICIPFDLPSTLQFAPVILPKPNSAIAAQFPLYLPACTIELRICSRDQGRRVPKTNDSHAFDPGRLSQGSEATELKLRVPYRSIRLPVCASESLPLRAPHTNRVAQRRTEMFRMSINLPRAHRNGRILLVEP
ncbi:hypothetical protein BJX63DRAFT_135120 [Aspergillus granulosus]|uniref:Uncharacterized protein n=1 Tax=Aspergillus granulosus TaxID=176169 RepID=A0ABR4HMN0_9EURO